MSTEYFNTVISELCTESENCCLLIKKDPEVRITFHKI